MSDEGGPGKQEIQEIFRRLRNISSNRSCFDCNSKNPTWASVTYGVFICIDCSAVHRSLGVHLSFVRSIQLDTTWTWTQLRNMQLGGNSNASAFFSQHNCTSTDAQQKYNSRAAHLYREKLNQLVSKFNKIHGNKIVFEDDSVKSPVEKETDFFEEIHSTLAHATETLTLDNSTRLTKRDEERGDGEGPSLDSILSPPSTQNSTSSSSASRKVAIGQRKPLGSKLGAKKGGLGAQKVKSDFSEIEKEAQMNDQMKERQVENQKIEAEKRAIDEEKQMASMKLAYQDLSKQQKKREEQLKSLDPKKAEQVERLGMGIGVRTGVSHSAMSDVISFEQETPSGGVMSREPTRRPWPTSDLFDEYEILDKALDGFSPSSHSSSSNKRGGGSDDMVKITFNGKVDDDDELLSLLSSPKYSSTSSSNYTKNKSPKVSTSGGGGGGVGDEAQKKFGNAKAISSEQFFNDGRDNDFERRTNLNRFDGKSSISSADYFGDGHQRNMQSSSSLQNTLQNVDLDDVKESVRQGVTKVADKLSTLANGLRSSLQEKYGY